MSASAIAQRAWRWMGDHAQSILAADMVLAGLGTAALPSTVISTCFLGGDASLSPGSHGRSLTEFVMQCFGAQAALGGLAIASQGSVPFGKPSAGGRGASARFFKNFGLAMIPFFILNAYFTKGRPLVRDAGMALDALNNIGIVVVCAAGYQRAQEVDAGVEKDA